ncbi:piggyBac transposable element-derived protein 4-like [Anneissia japonica]|uniref:piggyBac transposable element-derived protein 4-like n=1 Tax=Anneissia japonica TaxID=1529436 RepID=UPI0014259538|nr:piggyBac transposable element-derived protein 4-like [Anneissia japonica]
MWTSTRLKRFYADGYCSQASNPNVLEHRRIICNTDFQRNNVKQRCASVYEPGCDLSIDESLLLFKGRLLFKRSRFGVKFYEICTSSGIMLDFLIYCGKQIEGNADLSATERIVDTLIQPFLVKGRTLFIDNYYTSPFLVDHLLKRNMYTVGTVQTKQKNFPEELAEHRIEKSEALFYAEKSCNILACKFRGKKDKANGKPMIVHMLSSKHTYGIESSGKKDRDNNDTIKPTNFEL